MLTTRRGFFGAFAAIVAAPVMTAKHLHVWDGVLRYKGMPFVMDRHSVNVYFVNPDAVAWTKVEGPFDIRVQQPRKLGVITNIS